MAQAIITKSFKVGNHPAIGKGVTIYEYENNYSPFMRIGQILKCYVLDSIHFFDVDVITDHTIELIQGVFMKENKSITDDLKGKVNTPKPIYGATK
jgi:hypothetical protein